MKLLKYVFLSLFISSAVFAQNVKITDFDIPVSSAKQALLNGFYNWSQINSFERDTTVNDTTYSVPDRKTINSNWQVDGLYNQFYTSPSYAWQLGLTGAIYGQRDDPDDLDFRARYQFDGDISKYFSNDKGFFGNFAASSRYTRLVDEFAKYDSMGNFVGYTGGENRPEINLFAGLGYGRQVNATPLAKAINIDEELKRSRVTSKYLPKTTMLNISRIIDRESEYRAKYKQIYKPKMIEDIQKEIAASGVADPTLMNSLGYYRIESVLFENYEGNINYSYTNPRYYGGDVRLGIGWQVLTRNAVLETPDPSLEARARYGYPIGLNHQLYGSVNLRSQFDDDFGKVWEGEGRVDYWYNMTNRVRFFANYSLFLVRDYTDLTNDGVYNLEGTDISYSNHRFGAGFLFYLENYITFQIQGAYDYLHDNSETFSTNAIVSFIIL
jgi:hypothetical protein